MSAAGQIAPRSRKVRGKAATTLALGEAARAILVASRYAMTLRQLFYALVSRGEIPKTEAAYGRLKRVMRDLREEGTVPWDWLVDHTRAVFRPRTWDGLEDLLDDSLVLYRRDLMRGQPVAIQLWAESDSIGSVIAQVADRYCVPTFIGRGYSARGYLWAAATDALAACRVGKEVHILHVGDHDPSGVDIYRDVEETLRLYAAAAGHEASVAEVRERSGSEAVVASTAWLHCERLALTGAQIVAFDLPVRPPKASDVRTAACSRPRRRGGADSGQAPAAALERPDARDPPQRGQVRGCHQQSMRTSQPRSSATSRLASVSPEDRRAWSR